MIIFTMVLHMVARELCMSRFSYYDVIADGPHGSNISFQTSRDHDTVVVFFY